MVQPSVLRFSLKNSWLTQTHPPAYIIAITANGMQNEGGKVPGCVNRQSSHRDHPGIRSSSSAGTTKTSVSKPTSPALCDMRLLPVLVMVLAGFFISIQG